MMNSSKIKYKVLNMNLLPKQRRNRKMKHLNNSNKN